MNLLDLMVKVGIDDQASSKMDGLTTGILAKATVIGNALYDATKFVAGKAVDMAKTIVGGAVEGYASYEQLTGGMKKLYRDASDTMIGYAQNAYKDVGISANKYMEGVAGFSEAMMKSVGNDSQKAAELSNTAMKDIADNANTFGKYTVDDLTQVYQALAKGQFQTLDNLNLGYGGSKEGMQQLIDKANQLKEANGETADLTIDKFSDMVEAIHLVQDDLRITGTTANEAMGTIEGSVNMTKAAWENFLTAIGSGDQTQIMSAVGGIVQSIFGKWDDEAGRRVGGIIQNVAPVVQRVGKAILDEIPSLASTLAYNFLELLGNALGKDAGWADGIFEKVGDLWDKFSGFFSDIKEGFDSALNGDDGESALIHLKNILEDVWGFVEENILGNGEAIGALLGTVASLLGTVADVITTILDVFGPLIPAIAGAVAALAAAGPIAGIFTAISGAISFFATVIVPALGMVQSFGGAIALFTTLLGGPIPILIAIGGAIVAFIATNEDAREALLKAWNAVVDFFKKLPDWFSGIWESIKSTLKTALDDNMRKWDEFKTNLSQTWEGLKTAVIEKAKALVSNVTNFFSTLRTNVQTTWENIKKAVTDRVVGMAKAVVDKVVELKVNATNRFNEIRDSITQAITNAKEKVTNAVGGMKDAVKKKFDEIVDWVRNIPRRITSALGNLGNLLWNSGSSIINGLWDGMARTASDMFGWVGGIAGTIANLKGPLPYDRKVLVDNGLALMTGLQAGLEKGFESKVKPYVSGLAMDVSASISPNATPAVAPVQHGVTVTGNTFVIREDADVRRVAEQLYNLANRGGSSSWSTSYSMA